MNARRNIDGYWCLFNSINSFIQYILRNAGEGTSQASPRQFAHVQLRSIRFTMHLVAREQFSKENGEVLAVPLKGCAD